MKNVPKSRLRDTRINSPIQSNILIDDDPIKDKFENAIISK